MADNRPETFEQPFNTKLETGPGPLHIKTARLTIPYDVVVPSVERREDKAEKKRLVAWLRAVGEDKLPSPSTEHLEPYITLTNDKQVKAKCESTDPKEKEHCKPPSVSEFRQAFKKLFHDLVNGSSGQKLPPVKFWGSWNEPDTLDESSVAHPVRAAKFWQAAESVVAESKLPCGCKVVAGEFSKYLPAKGTHDYVEKYRNEIKTYCSKCWDGHHGTWQLDGSPRIWGFHDYEDVVHRNQTDAKGFADFTASGLGKPKLWIGEAAVELENKFAETELTLGCEKPESKCSAEELEGEGFRQIEAAEDFLTLHTAEAPHELSRYEHIYYYQYKGTLPGKVGEFDSGLLNSKGEQRETYCVLVSYGHPCPGG